MPDIPFTVFSGISVLLCIPPAYFNWKIPYRPWATLILIAWIFLLNLMYFFDSIIWSSTNLNTWWNGYIYCDITARLKDMFAIGVPGAAIGICRFLADATNPDPAQKDLKHGRLRRNLIDFFLGVLFPIMLQGLKFLAEFSRYHIRGVNGCVGTIYNAWPSLPLYVLWTTILCLVAAVYSCKFLYHWWVRRKRLNETWALGMRNGISQGEFNRLIATVLCVLFVYLPLSLIGLASFCKGPLVPFIWSAVHGPFWKIIVKEPRPVAIWTSWIGVALAITQFVLVGFTRTAKRGYEQCIEWIYDHMSKKWQDKKTFIWMKKISDLCKQRRAAQSVANGDARNNIVMVESRPRKKAAQNWFDSEEDHEDDVKSLHSSESTLTSPSQHILNGRDEEEANPQAGGRISQLDLSAFDTSGDPFTTNGTRTQVTAGSGAGNPGWTQGVKVTRQVIVETTSR